MIEYINWYYPLEKCLPISTKVNVPTYCNRAILLVDMYPREMKTFTQRIKNRCLQQQSETGNNPDICQPLKVVLGCHCAGTMSEQLQSNEQCCDGSVRKLPTALWNVPNCV